MRRLRRLAWWCGLNLVYIALSLAALEVGVRLTHSEADLFFQADPLLGWRLIPGQSGWMTRGREFRTRIEINAHGYRDVAHALEKPDGVFRILVLGDSNAEAMPVPLEKSFPRILEEELNRGQPVRVEVINTGVSNYGTASQLLSLRRDGVRYKPDLVLLAFTPATNVFVNSPELEKTLTPVYGADGSIERVRPPFGKTGILARSKAYRYLRRLLLVQHPRLAELLVRLGLVKARAAARFQHNNIPAYYFVYTTPDAVWQKAWSHTERLLNDLHEEVRRIGARLVVAILSSRDEVYREWWEEEFQAYPKMRRIQWDLDAPRQRIASLCEAKGIPYLALAPILRGARNGEPLHFRYDGHLTPAGNERVAREMAEFILARGLVRPPAAPTDHADSLRTEIAAP